MMDRRLLHRLRSERGTTLVEVIAAAIILVVVAGAVTSLLSNAQQQSGQSRVFAIAGDLAQSELEQLRAKRFSDLVGLDQTVPDVQAGGLKFTVRRQSAWELEGTAGASGCTVASKSAEALRVSVTVTWESMTRRPLTLDTMVAAPPGSQPNKGNYIVQVNRRDGSGVSGLTVSMAGATPLSGTTDVNGCVRFNELTAGPYTASFQRPGWVDVLHENPISAAVTVVAGETGNKTFDYDNAGGFNVGFRKRIAAAPTYADQPVSAVQFVHTGLSVPGTLNTTAPANTVATESKPMYPHASPYAVKAESCPAAGTIGNVAVAQGVMDPPTRTYFYLPQLRLEINALESSWIKTYSLDKSSIRVRIQTSCGTMVTPAGGLGGTLSNPVAGVGTEDRWTSSNPPIAIPPGTLKTVCIFARRTTDNVWLYARAPDLTVGTSADETDDTGKLYRTGLASGNDFIPDVAGAGAAATATEACPAI
jgi:Tfp pilus assembly protein PilV